MTRPDRRACLCGCNSLIRRTRSLPLCSEASARLRVILRQRTAGLDPNEHVRAFNQLYGSEAAVVAALRGMAA